MQILNWSMEVYILKIQLSVENLNALYLGLLTLLIKMMISIYVVLDAMNNGLACAEYKFLVNILAT